MSSFEKSKQLIAEATQYLPGGVNSNFRLGMVPTPLVFEQGEGPYLYDVDGNRLIDYYLGMGPMILGHNPESVVCAVQEHIDSNWPLDDLAIGYDPQDFAGVPEDQRA